MLELMCWLNDIYAYHICLVPQKKDQEEDYWRMKNKFVEEHSILAELKCLIN